MGYDLRVPADVLVVDDEAELCRRVIEPAYNALGSGDGTGPVDVLRRLTPGQRALLAVYWCVAESFKGGLDECFTNPNGMLTYDARLGFVRFGVPEGAMILIAAQALLVSRSATAEPDESAVDEPEDAERADEYLAAYEPLHARFNALVDHDFYPRAAAYVRAHPHEFVR